MFMRGIKLIEKTQIHISEETQTIFIGIIFMIQKSNNFYNQWKILDHLWI